MKVIVGNGKVTDTQNHIYELATTLLGNLEIHEVFHVLRNRLDINQAEIAKQTNIKPILLSMFERGTIILPENEIEKLLIKIKELQGK